MANLSADGAPRTGSDLPPLPGGWPRSLELGTAAGLGNSGASGRGFGLRYQYLAGGVNTGQGWVTWNPNASFVGNYVRESSAAGLIPVLSYYMLRQSLPGVNQGEADGVKANLDNPATMRAYYEDLSTVFREAANPGGGMVILHFEPDLWGYIQQRARDDDAATVPVSVASSGYSDAAGFPDTAAGMAQLIRALRDRKAPNVLLAYHMSVWGSGEDPLYGNPPDDHMRELAGRLNRFYASLGAPFDMAFSEFSDRDSGFKEHAYGDGGASWWDAGDFARHLVLVEEFVRAAGLRMVIWQIPLGNTRMRSVNNTWDHYQDNKVEWLLADAGLVHLKQYAQAGVIAFLFGRGADGATCACDDANDGVTNPQPINGNTQVAVTADDDGGFFWERSSTYISDGKLVLP